jgi:hypothetical protein
LFVALTHLHVPFSSFSAKIQMSGTPPTGFEINSSFTLGDDSNGISPLTEAVTLQLGSYSVTIPKNSFTKTRRGKHVFEGTIDGLALQAQIAPMTANSYRFTAEGSGARLGATNNPLNVGLTIGDDAGTTTVTAEIE